MSAFRKPSFLITLILAFWFHSPADAQARPQPGLPSSSELAQVVRRAGYVFEGTVMAVARSSNSTTGVATVQITFRIDRGIRGTRAGQTLTVREWAGLWEAGERYRSGERVLLCLYPLSKLGLTSPVGGALGRFAVDPKGFVNLQPAQVADRPGNPGVEPRTPGTKRVSSRELADALRRSLE